MAKVTQPMLTMSFKDVKDRITILETSRTIAEENRLVSEKDILRCLLYTSPSPRDRQKSRMPSSA